MTIPIKCPHCGKQYRLKDKYAGKTVTCRECDEKFNVDLLEAVGVHLLRPAAAVIFDALRGDPHPIYQYVSWKIGVDVSPGDVATHRDSQTGQLYAILMSEGAEMKVVPNLCSRADWNEQADYNDVPRR